MMNRCVIAFLVCLAATPLLAIVTGTVRGSITDPDHRAIPGAKIVIKSATSDDSRTLTSKPDGTFELNSLPIGMYRVTITQPGLQAAVREFAVNSGGVSEVNVELKIAPTREEIVV